MYCKHFANGITKLDILHVRLNFDLDKETKKIYDTSYEEKPIKFSEIAKFDCKMLLNMENIHVASKVYEAWL